MPLSPKDSTVGVPYYLSEVVGINRRYRPVVQTFIYDGSDGEFHTFTSMYGTPKSKRMVPADGLTELMPWEQFAQEVANKKADEGEVEESAKSICALCQREFHENETGVMCNKLAICHSCIDRLKAMLESGNLGICRGCRETAPLYDGVVCFKCFAAAFLIRAYSSPIRYKE